VSLFDGKAFLKHLDSLKLDLVLDVRGAVTKAVKEAEQDAKATKLFKDGKREWGLAPFGPHLRDTIQGKVTSNTTAELRAGDGLKYAQFVESGTSRHLIQGNPTLRFEWQGSVMFRRSVDHPGTQPRPFMKHAGEWGGLVLEQELQVFTDRSIRRFNSR
jgi:hypothetical protein